jgi:cation:H+ antiporter
MSTRWLRKIALACTVALPSLVLRVGGIHPAPEAAVLVFGAAVVAAAFLLAWAAEAAQVDISASLATAVLAFIAVLPEYAVDLYFAYAAGSRPAYAQYAAANMTGSNRLLIGLGWPLVGLVYVWALRKQRHIFASIVIDPKRRVELAFLAVASTYSLVIPLFRRISLLDAAILLGLFGAYLWRTGKEEQSEPELVGVAASLAALPRPRRRAAVAVMFVMAAAFVLSAAEPFANALVSTGKRLGVDEFLLVQWLAPLASESPELIVAAILASRGHGGMALGTLLSSKVNQWTLLVGSLPVAYLVGGGGTAGLALDARQTEEFILTAAQTVLGLAVLVDLRFRARESMMLLALFVIQFPFPQPRVRLILAVVYFAVALGMLLHRRKFLLPVLRALRPGGDHPSSAEGP